MDVHELDSGAGTAFQRWSHVSELEFAGLPSAVPCGRLHIRQVLWEWELDQLTPDAELVASELLSNGVKASSSPEGAGLIGLRLRANPGRLLIEVWDQNPHDPQLRLVDAESERGRGLLVVEAIAHRWGCRRVSASVKVVWAELLTANG